MKVNYFSFFYFGFITFRFVLKYHWSSFTKIKRLKICEMCLLILCFKYELGPFVGRCLKSGGAWIDERVKRYQYGNNNILNFKFIFLQFFLNIFFYNKYYF